MKKIKIYIILLFVFGFITLSALAQDVFTEIDSGYIQVDQGKLFYEIAGVGKDVILIHDGLIHHEIWDEQFPVLAEDHRVVRYDRRGYGKSPNPQTPYSDIEDLKQLLIQLKIDRTVLIGMSAGGSLAIDFALKYPENVGGLILAGAVVSGYGYSDHMITRGGRVNDLEELLADPQKIIHYFGWEDPYQIYPKNVAAKERCLKLLESFPNNANFERYNYMLPVDRPAVKFLSEINVPTLVLVGEFDIPDVHAHAGVIEAGIPNAKREIVLKAGHLIPLEQPKFFNELVLKFFQKEGIE